MADDLPPFEASYGAIEAALMAAHRLPDRALGAFRGRLGALQKAGLLGARSMPGKGKAIRYRVDQLHRLVCAVELLEFGITPALIVALVDSQWERRLRKIFAAAEDAAERDPGPADVILHISGAHLLGDALSDALPAVNSCTLGKLPDYMAMMMAMQPNDSLPPRALVTNLSGRLRHFHAEFARTYMDELAAERRREQRAKRKS